MNELETIRIQILGLTDAAFCPMREADWHPPAPGNIYHARHTYPTDGVRILVEGDGADQKRTERTVHDGIAMGLIVPTVKRLRRTGLRLTDLGDWLTRAIVGQPDAGEAYRLVVEVARLGGDDDRWVSELTLAGVPGYSDGIKRKLVEVEDNALPALVRGWLESNSDRYGHAWYRLLPAGRRALEHPEPVEPPGLPDGDPDARRFYIATVEDERERLRTAEPGNPKEIGFVPLPCSSVNPTRETVNA
ncbi:MAG: hypothetical protein NTW96_01890 [Planctomycetia bacterium]|nr:hypothetical protein [Planctomycetia bacterium]